jgi:hypothetical protein
MITKKPLNNIVHFEYINEDGEPRYLCIHACETFEQKRTTDVSKVTCLNCIRRLHRKND